MPPKRVRSKSPGPAKAASPGKKSKASAARSRSPKSSASRGKSPGRAPASPAGGNRSGRARTPSRKHQDSQSVSLVPDTSSNAGPQRRTLKQVPSPQPKKKILKRSISYEEAMEAKELTELRKDLTLFKKPLTTLYLFGGVVFDTVFVQPLHWAADPANLVYVATAAVLTLSYLIAHYVQGSHSAALGEVEHMFAYSMWWFGLGVASSIGLGTGAHTGLLSSPLSLSRSLPRADPVACHLLHSSAPVSRTAETRIVFRC